MKIFAAVLLIGAAWTLEAGDVIVHRDWTRFPAVVERDTPNDIYAIGDAHSDYVRLARLMHGAGLIAAVPAKPAEVQWTAGHSVLVSTGDMIDKGPRPIDVLLLLQALRADAVKKGGIVLILAGNHEAEFLANPRAPKGKDFAAHLKGVGINPDDVGACRTPVGDFLCSLAFGARVNDWFFSHAGNSGGRSLLQLTVDLQKGVDEDGFRTRQLVDSNSLLEARLDEEGPHGRPWIFEKDASQRDERTLLAGYAAALGVHHIVEGHKPSEVKFSGGLVRHPGEMFQRDGLLFLIDTGLSEGVNDSYGAVLHITPGGKKAEAICPDGGRTELWDVKNPQDFGRAAPCGK